MPITLNLKQSIIRNSQFIMPSLLILILSLLMLILSIPVAFATPTLYIFPTPMQQVSGSVPFSTQNQSLRGAGAGTTTVQIPLLNQSWNKSAHVGDFVTLRSIVNRVVHNSDVSNWIDKHILELDHSKFGGGASGDTSGHVKFGTGIDNITYGQVNVDLPVNVVLDFPQANSFRGGDTIVIRSRYTVDTANSNMTTTPLGGDLILDGDFGINTGVSAQICIKDCTSLPGNTRVKFNHKGRIVQLPSDGIGYKIDPVTSTLTGVTGVIRFPSVVTNSPSKQRDGTMEDLGEDLFTQNLNIDIDSYLKYVGGPPLGKQTPKIKGVQVGYDLIDYSFDVNMTQKRHVKFQPNGIDATLNLGSPMTWAVLEGNNESQVLASGYGSAVPFQVGDSIALTLPAGKITETAASSDYTLRNTFTHQDDMVYDGAYKNEALELNFTVPEFQIYGGSKTCVLAHWVPPYPHCHKWDDVTGLICLDIHGHSGKTVCDLKVDIPRIAVGPLDVALPGPSKTDHLLSASVPLPSTTDHFLPKTSHELAFASQAGPAFSIDPENPVIVMHKEVSKVVNHGGGSRTVTYTMLVRNTGDVPLDAVQVQDSLAGTFNGAIGFNVDQVHSCKLTVNPIFDGVGDVQVVMPVYTLDPAEEAVIELQVTVNPQAFPPLYANVADTDGTSVPRGTNVIAANAADAATVNMGPAEITALSDFVLFADEEVKLDGLLNSTGHIGSNEKIKIGEHNHSVLAGDLRARKEIKVEGLLTADYAISGSAVKQEDDGILTLTGGQVNDAAMAVYLLPQPVFTAGGAKVKVSAQNGALTLLPGSYGKVHVKAGGVLLLTAGEYFFEKLSLDSGISDHGGKHSKKHDGEEEIHAMPLPSAILGFDTSAGRVTLNIVGKVRLGNGVKMEITNTGGSTRDVAINIQQDDELLIPEAASVQGVLSAPNAELEFAALSSIEGAAYAKSIRMDRGSVAHYHAVQWQGSLYRRIDANCDGIPDYQ